MSQHPTPVGRVRPSQLMFTYGVGAIVDLPKLSVIVTGLEDWPTHPPYAQPIIEDRLLMAVRTRHHQVSKLLSPPVVPETGLPADPFDGTAHIGVPVATFPRWMVCPNCRLLANLKSGLFKLDEKPYYPDRTVYRHQNCEKGKKPQVFPARFLVACEKGHLDDFPWLYFAHKGEPCDSPWLRLIEFGATGEARDLEVRCSCGAKRRLSDAFGKDKQKNMPLCRGRRPHLRDYDTEECEHHMRTLVLGASNTWFPMVFSAVSIPVESGKLGKSVDENWATLQNVTAPVIIGFMRSSGQLGELSSYDDESIWQAIEDRRARDAGEAPPPSERVDLREPEWRVFSQCDTQLKSKDFRLRAVEPPPRYAALIEQVTLVERLREVRALVGFARLDAPGELTDPDLNVHIRPAPISRQPPTWVPASEVRGEGIFIRFSESKLLAWQNRAAVRGQGDDFLEAHVKWCRMRLIEEPERSFPGMRYVLLHSFAHVLIRQLALECGYAAASIRERIYSRRPDVEGGPMAGMLLYTSAPDSEGTLGGLVSLGEPEILGRHIAQALETASLCAGDPLCAEHPPSQAGRTLHAAACHACLFASETSCERGNKYLDRAVLVGTITKSDLAFFE